MTKLGSRNVSTFKTKTSFNKFYIFGPFPHTLRLCFCLRRYSEKSNKDRKTKTTKTSAFLIFESFNNAENEKF